jgi:hypothetical protein
LWLHHHLSPGDELYHLLLYRLFCGRIAQEVHTGIRDDLRAGDAACNLTCVVERTQRVIRTVNHERWCLDVRRAAPGQL